LTRCLLGPVLRGLRQDHPNALVRVTEAPSGPLLGLVSAQSVDFAIVPVLDPPDALEIAPLGRVHEMLVTRMTEPALHGAPVDLREVSPLRLVLPAHGNIRAQRILRYLVSIGREPDDVIELDSMFAVLEFVRNSDFAAVLPSVMMLQEIADQTLCVRPISDPPFQLPLGVVKPRRATLTPLGRVVLERLARGFDAAA
jgi:DNA-binding transcriptional LysR family regulator